MNFRSYVSRQKNNIMARHMGEELFSQKQGQAFVPLRSSDEIMASLRMSKGLNTAERSLNRTDFTQVRRGKVYDIA